MRCASFPSRTPCEVVLPAALLFAAVLSGVQPQPGEPERVPFLFPDGIVFDARLALTLRHHGVTEFATRNDSHFTGFGFTRLWNPLPT